MIVIYHSRVILTRISTTVLSRVVIYNRRAFTRFALPQCTITLSFTSYYVKCVVNLSKTSSNALP